MLDKYLILNVSIGMMAGLLFYKIGLAIIIVSLSNVVKALEAKLRS